MLVKYRFIGRLFQKRETERYPWVFVAAGVVVLFLSSCQMQIHDPVYGQLVAQADSSPAPDAIVGTWRQRGSGSKGGVTYTRNLLVRPNGTGHWYLNYIPWAGGDNESDGEFTWIYKGEGVWTNNNCFSSTPGEFRIVNGERVLLGKNHEPLAMWHTVYDRQ